MLSYTSTRSPRHTLFSELGLHNLGLSDHRVHNSRIAAQLYQGRMCLILSHAKKSQHSCFALKNCGDFCKHPMEAQRASPLPGAFPAVVVGGCGWRGGSLFNSPALSVLSVRSCLHSRPFRPLCTFCTFRPQLSMIHAVVGSKN